MAKVIIPASGATMPSISASDSVLSIIGSGEVTGGTDLSALADITDFNVSPTSARSIGTGGNNLKMKVTGAFVHEGSGVVVGEAYQGGAVSTWAMTKLLMQSGGEFRGRNGTFTYVEKRSGVSNFNGLSIVPGIYQGGGDLSMDFITGTSGLQAAHFMGGTALLQRGLDTNATAPKMTVSGNAHVRVGLVDVTDAIIASPGSSNVPMGTGATSSGIVEAFGPGAYLAWEGFTIDTLVVLGGAQFDARKCPFAFTCGAIVTDVLSRSRSFFKSQVPGVAINYSSITVRGAATTDQILSN